MGIRTFTALVSVVATCQLAAAQGPATKLSLTNSTDETVIFSVHLPDQIVNIGVPAGETRVSPLRPCKDDRLLAVYKATVDGSSPARPWTIYAVGHFNASQASYPVFGAAIVKDAGHFVLQFYVKPAEGKVKPVGQEKLFEQHRQAIEEAIKKSKEETPMP